MKQVFILLFFIHAGILIAQNNSQTFEPLIKGFGETFEITNPDLILQKDKVYNVIFDVYTDKSEGKSINPLINTVARFLNMHIKQGVPAKNMNVVLVLHGKATLNLIDTTENPNLPLFKALNEANVTMYACGQSLKAKGLDKSKITKQVKVSLSALTALVEYQSKGYQLINFN